MKKDRLLNPNLISAIAAIGHTDLLVIGDAGLPVPKGVPVIDLSLVRGIPSFLDVLHAVLEELVVESYILAEEMESKNGAFFADTQRALGNLPCTRVSHEEFKRITGRASVLVRTGETTPYANVILQGGVNF